MGLFNSAISKIKGSIVGKALDTLSAAFISPVSTAQAIISKEKTIKEVIAKVEAKPLSERITSTLMTTAVVGTAVYGIGAIATKGIIPVVSSIIPKTATGKIITAISLPVVIGAVVGKPELIEELPKVPSQSFEIAKGIASGKGVLETIKENPVGAAVLGGAAAIIGGKIAGSVASAVITKKILEKSTDLPITKEIDTNEELPVTSPTQTIQTGKKPRRKAKFKPQTPNIRQSMNIMISNKSIGMESKKYIKEYVYN